MSDRRGNDRERPLYMISVAAELSGMHPQTLRIYERRRLVQPQRSAGNTRLYSDADVERLRLIQRLTQDEGVNLSGVLRIMELQAEMDRLRAELEALRAQADAFERRLASEVRLAHAGYRADIVLAPRGGIARRG
ncbi:MAG: helix-turn-helix transcriptional regulator [Coriobacteriia bacterium]